MTTGALMDSDNLPDGFSFDQYGGHLVLVLNVSSDPRGTLRYLSAMNYASYVKYI